MSTPQTFSLKRVTEIIQAKIELQFPSSFWVRAEINKLGYNPFSKHAYPELVEKEGGKIVAQMQSTLFARNFEQVNNRFLQVLNEPLKDGITALLHVKIQFSNMYGLSLNIIDIDPSYTLGALERERLETIQKLKEEGVFERNKQQTLPLLLQRLAIISGEGTQGYSDFISVLKQNPYKYAFYTQVFSAVMQGDPAIDSIKKQLSRIKKVKQHFDAVIIIRGGGGNVGMTCYNDYGLSREIALFPLPVFTGIGHSTNEFVADLVAHSSSITPTGIANQIIDHFRAIEEPLDAAEGVLTREVLERLQLERESLNQVARNLNMLSRFTLQRNSEIQRGIVQRLLLKTNRFLSQEHLNQHTWMSRINQGAKAQLVANRHALVQTKSRLKQVHQQFVQEQGLELVKLGETIRLLDPQLLLKRGYSITTDDKGTIIKSLEQLHKGDKIVTQIATGKIQSIVE